MVPMHSTAVDALLEVIFISRGFYWICSEGFFFLITIAIAL